MRRGDIYYADLRPVIGSEQGGIRPVLIIQNDIGNKHSPTVICAAMADHQSNIHNLHNVLIQMTDPVLQTLLINCPELLQQDNGILYHVIFTGIQLDMAFTVKFFLHCISLR